MIGNHIMTIPKKSRPPAHSHCAGDGSADNIAASPTMMPINTAIMPNISNTQPNEVLSVSYTHLTLPTIYSV